MDNDSVKFIGSLLNHGPGFAGAVFDSNHVSPTLTTMQGGGREPHILDVKRIGNIYGFDGGSYDGNVFDEHYLSPTLRSCMCHGSVPEIVEVNKMDVCAIDEQNNLIRNDIVGTIMADGSSPKHNNRVAEIEPMVKIREANKKGYGECKMGGVADLNYASSDTRRGRVQENGDVCPALATENVPSVIDLGDPDFYSFIYEIDEELYLIRIRKLIPLECWRLMGFSDEDFYKAKYEVNEIYLEGGEKKCNAKLKVVNEKQRQKDMETYVLCTINDSENMEILKTIWKKSAEMPESEKIVNASFVVEKLEKMEHTECATSTIKCGTYMGMRYTMIPEKDPHRMDIIVQVEEGSTNIGKFMKITTESNLNKIKLFTILTFVKQITELKIFSSSIRMLNIQGVMQICEISESNIQMKVLNLKMENIIERSSNTVLYKQAGNSIVKNILVAVFGQLLPGKENVYKEMR